MWDFEGKTMTKRVCANCRWFRHDDLCWRYPKENDALPDATCGEWSDASITPEQHERRELVRKFALSIVAGWYASANRLPEDEFVWPEEEPWRVWEQAEIIVEWEGRKEGDGPEEQT